MTKNGHSNAAYVSDHADKLELAEKGQKNKAIVAKDPDYNPYHHREVEHPTT